ncbi:MAG: ABC transporter permease [Anaerolineales bacterium]|nr:ABC transporter permease [Anaerolineales bacterium]MBX3036549.1 ABC transporter permease [Anaerolineales bacterium]
MATDIASLDSPVLGLESVRKPLTPGQLIWRRFLKHRMAVAGMISFAFLLLFILGGSLFVSSQQANAVDLQVRLSAPSQEYWMGTDDTGRDIFARIIHGGQISLFVGATSVIISVTLGTLIGGLSGYFGGWVDTILMRFTESMLSIPQLFLLIVLGKFIGRNITTINIFGITVSGSVLIVICVIGLTSWMALARIVRANVLSLKELDYVSVSKSLGSSEFRIFFRHLIPNTMGVIIVATTLGLAGSILSEAYVSFLGLGIQPPTASWGNMLTAAQTFVQQGSWWMWVFPSTFIVLTILSVNLMGDGLRDAFDPRSNRHM